jgi:hypothetical protein
MSGDIVIGLNKHRIEALTDGIYMLMILLARIGRRMEAREAEKAALLSSDRPFP